VVPRITRRGYTCQLLHTAEIKAYQCEKTIVYRESSRSGRWSSKATRDSRAGGPCCRLSSLFLSPSFLRIRPPTYLFLSPSLAPFLPRLLLYFCPFARFLLPQTTAAYLYPVFASRGTERGCFCVYSLLPSCRCCRRSSRSIPFFFFLSSSFIPPFRDATRNSRYVTSSH